MKRKLTFALLFCLIALLAMSGCSFGANRKAALALDELVEKNRASISELEETFNGGMTLDFEARDNSMLVCIHNFTFAVGDRETVALGIAEALEGQRAVYEGVAADLREQGVKNAAVVLEYWDADGTLIYTVTIS